jgi:hypothetical protein
VPEVEADGAVAVVVIVYSYPDNPLPPISVEAVLTLIVLFPFVQLALPPVIVGTVGGVLSTNTLT